VTDLKVVRKGNSLNKLTIAKDRIEMKLQDDVSPEGEAWLRKFAEFVVMDATIYLREWKDSTFNGRTMRGRFQKDKERACIKISIGIHDGGHVKVVKTYYSDKSGLTEPPKELL
jgi:hypothetical protein